MLRSCFSGLFFLAGGLLALPALAQVPSVTGVSPTSGPAAGGTSVAITGTSFTGATAVTFGTTSATSFTVISATSITATSPAGTGTVDVTVVTPGGTSPTSSPDHFTYVPAAVPTMTGWGEGAALVVVMMFIALLSIRRISAA